MKRHINPSSILRSQLGKRSLAKRLGKYSGSVLAGERGWLLGQRQILTLKYLHEKHWSFLPRGKLRPGDNGDLENVRFYERARWWQHRMQQKTEKTPGLSSKRTALENWERVQAFCLILHFSSSFWNIGLWFWEEEKKTMILFCVHMLIFHKLCNKSAWKSFLRDIRDKQFRFVLSDPEILYFFHQLYKFF